jgi:hypothetical protein
MTGSQHVETMVAKGAETPAAPANRKDKIWRAIDALNLIVMTAFLVLFLYMKFSGDIDRFFGWDVPDLPRWDRRI